VEAWRSKYGSIFSSIYDGACVDGMNERGLVGNLLKCAKADFGDITQSPMPRVSIGAWNQYFLDNFASVEEAVLAMLKPAFVIDVPALPNGKDACVHLAISDASGDSAVFAYIDGELVIKHEKKTILKSLSSIKQAAINKYWEMASANTADNTSPMSHNKAEYFSMMRSIAVPYGMASPDYPSVSATMCYMQADHHDKRYYFESTFQESTFWLDVARVNLEKGAPIINIEVSNINDLYGDVSSKLTQLNQFNWL
jgi:choloylglycine hydrolase